MTPSIPLSLSGVGVTLCCVKSNFQGRQKLTQDWGGGGTCHQRVLLTFQPLHPHPMHPSIRPSHAPLFAFWGNPHSHRARLPFPVPRSSGFSPMQQRQATHAPTQARSGWSPVSTCEGWRGGSGVSACKPLASILPPVELASSSCAEMLSTLLTFIVGVRGYDKGPWWWRRGTISRSWGVRCLFGLRSAPATQPGGVCSAQSERVRGCWVQARSCCRSGQRPAGGAGGAAQIRGIRGSGQRAAGPRLQLRGSEPTRAPATQRPSASPQLPLVGAPPLPPAAQFPGGGQGPEEGGLRVCVGGSGGAW